MRFALFSFIMLHLLLLVQAGLWAQGTEIPVIDKSLVPLKGIYRFSSFSDGSIIFRSGIMSAARMNYNISFDEMHFINQQGDTLSVAAPPT